MAPLGYLKVALLLSELDIVPLNQMPTKYAPVKGPIGENTGCLRSKVSKVKGYILETKLF